MSQNPKAANLHAMSSTLNCAGARPALRLELWSPAARHGVRRQRRASGGEWFVKTRVVGLAYQDPAGRGDSDRHPHPGYR
jgi:hypothetical protein